MWRRKIKGERTSLELEFSAEDVHAQLDYCI